MLLIAAAALLPVQSQAADNGKTCAGTAAQGITPDMVIAACTDVIVGADNPAALANVYYNRGNAYYDKGDFAHAISDYDHALNLKPDYQSALFNRGLAKKRSGNSAGGDADLAAAKAMKAHVLVTARAASSMLLAAYAASSSAIRPGHSRWSVGRTMWTSCEIRCSARETRRELPSAFELGILLSLARVGHAAATRRQPSLGGSS